MAAKSLKMIIVLLKNALKNLASSLDAQSLILSCFQDFSKVKPDPAQPHSAPKTQEEFKNNT
jgi:hypothetical protein